MPVKGSSVRIERKLARSDNREEQEGLEEELRQMEAEPYTSPYGDELDRHSGRLLDSFRAVQDPSRYYNGYSSRSQFEDWN